MSKNKPPTYVTLMMVPDGSSARRSFRMRAWVLNTLMVLGGLLVVGMVTFFVFYGTVIKRAALTESLVEENARLRLYQYKVRLLEENLNQTRQIVGRLTELAGIDYEFPELPDDSTLFAALEETPGATVSWTGGTDLNWPTGLPIQGFVTQDFELDDSSHYHAGVDIACAVGTPVLVTANGVVVVTAVDSIYGHLLVVRHSDSVETRYGHNDSLLVMVDQAVSAGSRVALSGNTGVSTAPHLHYEVRVNNEPIDPLKTLYHEKNE